jgi:eukaryotic-like serine/threonine-protein kinase
MIGSVVSHYRVLELLGSGGMGVVYKAEDTQLKRTVALKFLPPNLTLDSGARERFLHEARAASALEHTNICSVHEVSEHDGRIFIVMGYYEGETLKSKIERGPLPPDQAVAIACQIAEGLSKAHDAGIIHRDIKPANIIVTMDSVVKILDFGLAKLSTSSLLTKSGTTLGTAAYMSPEQARGEAIDKRSDIWSLGVTLYEMLAGKRPFVSEYEHGLIYMIINDQPAPLEKLLPDESSKLIRIVNRALEKKADSRYASAAEMLADLRNVQKRLHGEESAPATVRTMIRRLRKPAIAIPVFTAIVAVAFLAVWLFNHMAQIRWAREQALPEIEQRIRENDMMRDMDVPYQLAVSAEQVIPDDPKLQELLSKCSVAIDIATDPPGANVFMRRYDAPETTWAYVGISPLVKVRLPMTSFKWKFEKEACETVLAASSSYGYDTSLQIVPYNLTRVLDKKGNLPPGMVRVQGVQLDGRMLGLRTRVPVTKDFYIDKFEVSNRQYKEFVDAGGYRNRQFWKHRFIQDGRELTWEQAMRRFVDESGQPGPSHWLGGDYQKGHGDFPVSGVSWYEAAAFAQFAGKSLPTDHHWLTAQGASTPFGDIHNIFSEVPAHSNFGGKGPVTVGILDDITTYGAYDMAGNAREWCWNETPKGRILRGGGWDDNPYLFFNPGQLPPMDRSAENGFRCALYLKAESISDSAFHPMQIVEPVDIRKLKPVSDPIFQVYKEQFSYDNTPLNARVEARKENPEGWLLEKITLDAAYGREQIVAYVFLPKNANPPYQTVIYFPSGDVIAAGSSKDIENYYEVPTYVSFMVKSGRAVLFPVYKGTFERGNATLASLLADPANENSRQHAAFLIQLVKDLKRCTDYLASRQDIDIRKLGYFGMSWGGCLGAIIPAVEERLKVSVLLGGGLEIFGRPEVNPLNYVTRVRIPTLFLIGRYDGALSFEDSHQPMFDLLGTAPHDKQLKLFETAHVPPRNEVIKETLAWLDRYLGPVTRN